MAENQNGAAAAPAPDAAAPAAAAAPATAPAAPASPSSSATTTATAAPVAAEGTVSSLESPNSVYHLIHSINATVVEAIDQPLVWADLLAPSVAYTVVKPIVKKYAPKPAKDDVAEDASNSLGAVLFALMANRIQFQRLVEEDLSQSAIQTTRAEFCELLAIKILRTWPDSSDEEELTSELVRNWGALDGAPDDIRAAVDEDDLTGARDSAIELAIVSASKRFLAQPIIQHLVEEIYAGRIVYQPRTTHSLIADNYVSPKTRRRRHQQQLVRDSDYDPDSADVYTYNPYLAGWLDYSRLKVPRWRNYMEMISFAALLTLFVITLSTRDLESLTFFEVLFIIYGFGVVLDEFAAARENGWLLYIANAWNMVDLSFIAIFLTYVTLRFIGLSRHSIKYADYAFDILALGACILFPRLVFFLMNSSVAILALRSMIGQYISFMALTAVAFSGVAFCLWELGKPNSGEGEGKSMREIVSLLTGIWFGSKGWDSGAAWLGNRTLGKPILFVYSMLCKTFLITMMMSMISQRYGAVYSNAQQEYLFQQVVTTLEGVKSDSVFSYLPGFNIIAVVTLIPLSYVLSEEQLHRVNVFMIRACNLPTLFAISGYERYRYRTNRRRIRLTERGQIQPTKKSGGIMDNFLGSSAEVLIHATFDLSPPPTAGASTPARAPAPVADVEATGAADVAPVKPALHREKTGALGKLFRAEARGSTVTVSAEEWNEVRASQKRLEELLAKVAAVSGV